MKTHKTLPIVFLALSAAAFAASPMRYAEDRAPGIVHPAYASTMSDARMDELVFEGLFTDDQELRSTPCLAASFTLADDKKSMELELRTDVKWHDGSPFVAKDVVFTIHAMKNPSSASTEQGRVGFIKEVKETTEHSVHIDFVAPEYAPDDKLHFKILPFHKFAGETLKRTDDFRTAPVGTGPFQLLAFNGDNSITLQHFPDWHGTSKLDQVVMREVADKNYQSKLLMYESLEALVRVLPRDIATLQNDRKVELYPYQTNSWWYLGYNLSEATFKDQKVRDAIHAMVDVEVLLAPIGSGDILTGPFVKSSPFYNHDVPMMTPDAEKAKQLLTDAGYTFSGRQWMDKKNQPLTLRLAAQENMDTAQDVVINLQSQLQAQGIVVTPVFLNAADWRQKVWKDHDFDMILSQWSFDRNEDIYDQFYSKGAHNFVSYANPEVDKLLDQARSAVDPQQKKGLMRQVHAKIAGDDPMVFLWTLDSYSAISTKVKNVVVHPFYFFTWADRWSMD